MGLYEIINSAVSLLQGGQEERSQMIRSLQGIPTNDTRALGKILAADPVKFIWVNGFINWSLISSSVIVSRIPSSSYYFSKSIHYKIMTNVRKRINKLGIALSNEENTEKKAAKLLKTALAASIRDLFPFLYQRGYIDVKTPRTFELRVPDDMKHFVRQYRINACISLMKRLVTSQDSSLNIQMFSLDATIPLDCLDFAVQRVVEMIRYYQHADLDEWHFSVVSEEDWNVFMFRFYEVIYQGAKFQLKHHSINIPKLTHSCEKLCAIYEKYFPETKNDGQRNLWIVKPSNGSCGRGVKIFKRLSEIQQYCKPTNSYVIQKYIENPLLIYNTKFDIRQWFLITSVYPLIIWMYDECYLRFCTQQFSLTNVHESVHLCNNSVQYKYKNGTRSSQLPDDNMWDNRTFQIFLSERDEGTVWPEIKNKMQQAIIAACLVSQDKMYHRTNSFHLYGADFMITPDYDVWLIEINTHPSMKYSTSVTSRMCREVLQDTLKVGLDRRSNPHADTGKFKEIYRQQTHMPTVGVPSSAAGVQARRIRLLSTTPAKEITPTKAFEVPSKISGKYPGKWLTYTAIANYKRHSKVNFKYVVLRHTDLPLDPGDSISQRDIGYAGVLDKIYLNESEAVEEHVSEEEISEKSRKEAEVTKVPPKPVNQITLHRKVITKLKNKDKTYARNSDVDPDIASSKSVESTKTQNIAETQNTNLQNEVPTGNADKEIHRSKLMHSEIIHEIRSVPEVAKEKTLNTETGSNYENTTKKIVTTKKQMNSEIKVNSKKIPNSEDTPNHEKLANTKKNRDKEKGETSKKFVKPDQVISSKHNTNVEKPVNLKKRDQKKKVNPEGYKIKVWNITKSKNNSKIVVVEEAAGTTSKSNKEHTCSKTYIPIGSKIRRERTGAVKTKDSSKMNRAKQITPIYETKIPNSLVEKIVSDKLQAESINFISISKKEKDTHPANHHRIKKNTISKKNNSEQSMSKSLAKSSRRNITSQTSNQTSSEKVNANSSLPAGISRPSKILNRLAASKKIVTTDSTRETNTSSKLKNITKKNEKIKDSITQNVKELTTNESEDFELSTEENGEEGILQHAFVPYETIFMMSDSEETFETAENDTDEELSSLSEGSINSIEKVTSEYMLENTTQIKDPNEEGKLLNSSMKRYRNKYCE